MAEFPKLPLWTDAYLGDTLHLTTIEHGAYLLLLITMWRTKTTSLPNDDRLLARYARLTPTQWRRISPILLPFFKVKNGVLTQGRLTDEANAVRQHSKRQSDRSKARWLKTKETGNAAGMPETSLTLSLSQPTVKKEAKASKKTPKISASSFPSFITPEKAQDYLDFRRAKRSPVTTGVMRTLTQALTELHTEGIDANDALDLAMSRNWQGFRAEWVRNSTKQPKANGNDEFSQLMRLAADSDRRAEAEPEMDDGADIQPDVPLLSG